MPEPVNCPGHGDDVDCEDDKFNPCSACVAEGNRQDRPTADTDPGSCRWCMEEAMGAAQCPYHGEAAQRGEEE